MIPSHKWNPALKRRDYNVRWRTWGYDWNTSSQRQKHRLTIEEGLTDMEPDDSDPLECCVLANEQALWSIDYELPYTSPAPVVQAMDPDLWAEPLKEHPPYPPLGSVEELQEAGHCYRIT